jgi:hypothetical protein
MSARPSDEDAVDHGANPVLEPGLIATRAGSVKRVAVGEGALAIRMIHERLESHQSSSDVIQQPPTTNGELQHV